MEFPRLVYRSATSHTVVNDQQEFDAAIKAGWFATVPECFGCEPEAIPEPLADPENPDDDNSDSDQDPELPEPTREELEEKARELGIGFNGNTKDETLLKKIEEVLAENP